MRTVHYLLTNYFTLVCIATIPVISTFLLVFKVLLDVEIPAVLVVLGSVLVPVGILG